jgi:hypothetical protein
MIPPERIFLVKPYAIRFVAHNPEDLTQASCRMAIAPGGHCGGAAICR